VHAPTEDKDIRVREQFYDDLQYGYTAKHDVVIILGDLNAKIAKNKLILRYPEGTHCMILQNTMVKWCATLRSRIICAS
jgi:hypothetical protein